jgi:hypothetical protein
LKKQSVRAYNNQPSPSRIDFSSVSAEVPS